MSDTRNAVTVIERPGLPDTTHPVVREMMAHSHDPAMLRELLAVQREYEAGEAKRAFTRSLVELKRDLPTVIARDKKVNFGSTNYTHTSLAAVMAAVTAPLTMHGFSLAWIPSTAAGNVRVTCRLTHSGGHHEETAIEAPIDNKGSKSAAQGVASTITLLSRYTALALLGIATADMADPEPAHDTEAVDSQRNLRVIASLKKYGHKREDAEAIVGRTADEWTSADVEAIKKWCTEPQEVPRQAASDELTAVLGAIATAATKRELQAIDPHAEKLTGTELESARAAYKARLETISQQPTGEAK